MATQLTSTYHKKIQEEYLLRENYKHLMNLQFKKCRVN